MGTGKMAGAGSEPKARTTRVTPPPPSPCLVSIPAYTAFCFELPGSAAKPRKPERSVEDPASTAGSCCGEGRGWLHTQGKRTLEGDEEEEQTPPARSTPSWGEGNLCIVPLQFQSFFWPHFAKWPASGTDRYISGTCYEAVRETLPASSSGRLLDLPGLQ